MSAPLLALALVFLAAGAALKGSTLDQTLFLALNQRATNLLPAGWWASLTNLGSTVVAAALLVAAAPFSLQPLKLAALAALPTTLLVHGLKYLLAQPRPAALLDTATFTVIDKVIKSGAFPSGHTATAVVMAGAWLITLFQGARGRYPAWAAGIGAAVVLLVAIGVALSRVAVGAHWPSDLLGGTAMGLTGLAVACWLDTRYRLWQTPRSQTWLVLAGLIVAATIPWDRGLYPSGQVAAWAALLFALVGSGVALRKGRSGSWRSA